MKKSTFIAMVLGTISGVIFALGMCMALIPEWGAFQPGVIFGCLGLLLGFITYNIWRRLEHKAPIQLSGKTILAIAVGVAGALLLGVGLCFCIAWGKMVTGIIIGLLGILLLLSLVPLVVGIYD